MYRLMLQTQVPTGLGDPFWCERGLRVTAHQP